MNSFSLTFDRELHDLNPTSAGVLVFTPGSSRKIDTPHVQICYVTAGKGTLHLGGLLLSIQAGQAFIVAPYQPTRCIADDNDPFSYEWVSFNGSLSQRFLKIPPVFKPEKPIFPHLQELQTGVPFPELRLMLDLMLLYATIVPIQTPKTTNRNYIQDIKDYVCSHYMHNLTIQDIADHIGLNRDYISKIFKAELDISIQAYLLDLRMQHAKRYLQAGCSISETGTLCGFNSLTHFSRQFKNFFGQSPTKWLNEKNS